MTDPIAPDDAVTIPRYIDEETRVVDVEQRLSNADLDALLWHGCSSGTSTPPMVRTAIQRVAIELQQRRAATAEYLAALADWDVARWDGAKCRESAARLGDALAALRKAHAP